MWKQLLGRIYNWFILRCAECGRPTRITVLVVEAAAAREFLSQLSEPADRRCAVSSGSSIRRVGRSMTEWWPVTVQLHLDEERPEPGILVKIDQ